MARVNSTNVNAPQEMSQEQDKGKGQHPNTLSLWEWDVWEVCKDGKRNPQDSQVHSTLGIRNFEVSHNFGTNFERFGLSKSCPF